MKNTYENAIKLENSNEWRKAEKMWFALGRNCDGKVCQKIARAKEDRDGYRYGCARYRKRFENGTLSEKDYINVIGKVFFKYYTAKRDHPFEAFTKILELNK